MHFFHFSLVAVITRPFVNQCRIKPGGHPSGGGQGEASFSNNGHTSPSTHPRHGKGCSAAPAWTHFSRGGTQTSRQPVISSPCHLNSHRSPKCWWEQQLGHGCPTCHRHALSERFQSLYHSILSSSQVQLMFKNFCLFVCLFFIKRQIKIKRSDGEQPPHRWAVSSVFKVPPLGSNMKYNHLPQPEEFRLSVSLTQYKIPPFPQFLVLKGIGFLCPYWIFNWPDLLIYFF